MDNKVPAAAAGHTTDHADDKPVFKGYSLDELRYRQAVVELKKTFIKEKMMGNVEKIKQSTPLLNGNHGVSLPTLGGIAGKVLNGMNFLDYAMIGFSLFSTGKKIFSFFRRKK